ncbi:hypothetical protein AB4068_05505 [Arthrobacter sp. 2RAF22]|uniref:hypothetical protein n=1 Tax=Arthrobacter sp. 2RAF22 TaxID=3232996 RepID=UPI003F929409
MRATHTVANRREHPRILILDDNWGFGTRLQGDVNLPGTVKVISDLRSVDQTEWDALITNTEYQTANFSGTSMSYRRVADHLYIFKVLPEAQHNNRGTLDRVKGLNQAVGPVTLQLQWEVPGHEVAVRQGLERELHDSLVLAVEARGTQSGLVNPGDVPAGVELDAFALGPKGIVLAGRLEAPNRGEVWFVPSEISDLRPWLTAAFASWRRRDPKKFPGVPDWWASSEWYSAGEAAIARRIAEETAKFDETRATFDATRKQLESELTEAQEKASAGSRKLLRGQDDALQDAVRDALEELGFGVRDMDLEWDDKERREDFRITDPDDPQWLVLGDATGVTGNAKGGKMAVLQGYVTKYIFEERPSSIPGMWYLLNREIEKDPNIRSTILRADEIDPFAAQQGLVLDTTALYVLLRHVHDEPSDKPAARNYLRTSVGLLGLSDALTWMQKRSHGKTTGATVE